MIKHLCKHKVLDAGITYIPNDKGEIFLPKRFPQFNPVDEPKKVIKQSKKKINKD